MNIQNIMHTQINKVIVTTSARLHMGFFDLTGSGFGSVGLAIDAPTTQIEIIKSAKSSIYDKSRENAANLVESLVNSLYDNTFLTAKILRKRLKIKEKFTLIINQVIPTHAGLGSGTQMALAVGDGLNQLFDLNLSVVQIGAAAGRATRSGIGVAAFSQGGFLVDTGKTGDGLPEIALRLNFPESWRVLLVKDFAHVGVHGAAESQAFQTLKPANYSLRDMVFNHMAPALQRSDLLAFGACMVDLQAYNGEYFAPIQGGHFASADVATVLAWLQNNGAACVGQSSWGPTGFAIFEFESSANAMQKQLQQQFADFANISFQIVRAKNTGALIRPE